MGSAPTIAFRLRGVLIRFAVLASGSGSNLQAIIDAAEPEVQLVSVVSDNPTAAALARAEGAGIPTAVIEWDGDRSRFTERVCDTAVESGAEALILAGFMRILAPAAIELFPSRILNIHPSLLPSFPGARAVEAALAAGVRITGVTVHFVDDRVDHGPIIAQRCVEVVAGDSVELLHRRIQLVEHSIYPEVVGAVARNRIRVVEGKVIWS